MSIQPSKQRRQKRRSGAEPIALRVTTRSGLRVSERAVERLSALNRDLRLERSAKKELIVMTPVGGGSSRGELRISQALANWNDASDLGVAFSPSIGFVLPNGAIRSPDGSWMSRARWESLSREEQKRFLHVIPDFVVELRSPSDRIKVVRDKLREYIEQGVRLGWLIDPQALSVEIYRPGRSVKVLVKPLTLSGEDVLPGFILNLKGILFD
jgi:Uma2 family endonuclease